MSEPIQCSREVDEAEEGFGEFVVTGGDPAVRFDATEEVLHAVAQPVVAAVVAGRLEPISPRRDTSPTAVGLQATAESLRIEAFVGHDPTITGARQQRQHRILVMPGATFQADGYRVTARVDQGGKLAVEDAFRAAHRLGGLAARGIGAMLVQLDVRIVQVAEAAGGFAGQLGQQTTEQSLTAPSPESPIHSGPLAEALRQVSPGATRPQREEYAAEHQAVVLPRATPSGTFCSSRAATAIRSIFLAAPNAALESSNDLDRACSASDAPALAQFHHFSNTP